MEASQPGSNAYEEFNDEGTAQPIQQKVVHHRTQEGRRNVEVQQQMDAIEPFRARSAYSWYMIGFFIINIGECALNMFSWSSQLPSISALITSWSSIAAILLATIDGIMCCPQERRRSFIRFPKCVGYSMSIAMFITAVMSTFGVIRDAVNNTYYYRSFFILEFFLISFPKAVIAYDWLKYYVYRDYEGLFGIHKTPLICVCTITFNFAGVLCPLIRLFSTNGYNTSKQDILWWIGVAFIVNAIVSAFVLLYSAYLMCTKRIYGNRINEYSIFMSVRIVAIAFVFSTFGFLAVIIGYLIMIFVTMSAQYADKSPLVVVLIISVYLSYTVPVALGLFKVKRGNNNNIDADEGGIALQAQ